MTNILTSVVLSLHMIPDNVHDSDNVVKETKKQEGHGHISPFLTLFIVSTFLVHFS